MDGGLFKEKINKSRGHHLRGTKKLQEVRLVSCKSSKSQKLSLKLLTILTKGPYVTME